MTQIYGTAETSLSVNIDQCSKCGGFWFDNQELFIISPNIAEEYDTLVNAQRTPDSLPKNRICPNCQLPLILLKDPELSKILQIDICPKCLGMWLDKGEFLQYKEYQKEKIERAKKEDALRAAENLRKLQGSEQFWQFLMSDPYRPMETSEATEFIGNLESVLLWLINLILGRLKV
jgi:Zn-finger nucleic acid-binding protein